MVGVVLLALLPMLAVVWLLHVRRKRYRAEASEPFTEMPLRPPGESTRLKLEQLSDDFDGYYFGLCLTCATGAMILLTVRDTGGGFIVGIVCVLVVGATWHFGRGMAGLQKEIWNYRLGFAGERAVAEELNQLLAEGWRVFHDLPFEAFNIDHVIVGPPGVYAVETKTYRKRADISGTGKAEVIYDGASLHFPRHQSRDEVEQARLNAETLAKWLTKATGEEIPVKAILTFPGWWVTRKARGAVNVLNPKEIRHSFPRRVEQPLSPERIQRIAHQLTERCRIPKDS